jgi:hypothetical protein
MTAITSTIGSADPVEFRPRASRRQAGLVAAALLLAHLATLTAAALAF